MHKKFFIRKLFSHKFYLEVPKSFLKKRERRYFYAKYQAQRDLAVAVTWQYVAATLKGSFVLS